ncbi:MAG: hypothetical protein AAB225_14275, partial [Acidobacteriota bacterium]
MKRHRLVETFPESLQQRLRRADGYTNRIGARNLAAQFGNLRFEGGFFLADLIHLRVQVVVGQPAAPVQALGASEVYCFREANVEYGSRSRPCGAASCPLHGYRHSAAWPQTVAGKAMAFSG